VLKSLICRSACSPFFIRENGSSNLCLWKQITKELAFFVSPMFPWFSWKKFVVGRERVSAFYLPFLLFLGDSGIPVGMCALMAFNLRRKEDPDEIYSSGVTNTVERHFVV
jgi:hypothetical protein